MASGIAIIGGIIVVIVIIAIVLSLFGGKPSGSTTTALTSAYSYPSTTVSYTTQQTTTVPGSSTSQTPVVMTDPPTVPAGTSALVMSYSDVMVHSSGTGAGASGWARASGSGTIDLTSLNSSGSGEVMAIANTTVNSSVDMVSYTVTSAQITVNGMMHNVTLPANTTVIAKTSGNARVNSSSSLIVDTAPVVTASSRNNTVVYTWAGTNASTMVYSNSTFTAQARVNVGVNIKISAGLMAQIDSVLGIGAGLMIPYNGTI